MIQAPLSPLSLPISAVIEILDPYLKIKNAEYLEGGLSNRCMKLTDFCGRHYVWRPKGDSTSVFGLSRENEFNALKRASDFGLTLPPVACFDEGLLVHWIEGKPLDKREINVSTLSRLLTSVHQLPDLKHKFEPFSKAEYYFQHLSSAFKTKEMKAIHHFFQSNAFESQLKLTVSHFDLGYYNLIKQDKNEIKIIDWEYSALGDPALDIVMASFANHLSLHRLVKAYCQVRGFDVELWLSICRRWKPVAQYLALFWYSLGFELYGDKVYKNQALILLKQLKMNLSSGANSLF